MNKLKKGFLPTKSTEDGEVEGEYIYQAREVDALLAELNLKIIELNQKIDLLHAKIRGMEKFRDRLRRIIK